MADIALRGRTTRGPEASRIFARVCVHSRRPSDAGALGHAQHPIAHPTPPLRSGKGGRGVRAPASDHATRPTSGPHKGCLRGADGSGTTQGMALAPETRNR